jgi:hypothetical protein
MPWLLAVGGQEQGSSYASGMKESARLVRAASFIPSASLHLTADHQQPRHYTPYGAMTQV